MLYRETHWLFEQGGVAQHVVLYRCPGGEAFARKRLKASPDEPAPDFEFHDARDGYREGVRTGGTGREVFVQTGAGASLQSRPLPSAPGAVIDAGFDAFVRTRWAALSAGQSLTVPFLIPSRFEHWRFSIAEARDGVVDGQPVRRLRMKVAAWYGFALPGIDLAYTPDGRRLVEFQGIGTVRDRQGRHLDVRIVFPPALRGALVPDGEAAAALAQPLVARCDGGVL